MTSDIDKVSDAVGGEGRKTFIARRISIGCPAMSNGNAIHASNPPERLT